jgi:hypothetical protein
MGSEVIGPLFLILALEGSEWSASRSCRFTPKEITPGTHWIEDYGEEKISFPSGIEPRPSSPLLNRLSYLSSSNNTLWLQICTEYGSCYLYE